MLSHLKWWPQVGKHHGLQQTPEVSEDEDDDIGMTEECWVYSRKLPSTDLLITPWSSIFLDLSSHSHHSNLWLTSILPIGHSHAHSLHLFSGYNTSLHKQKFSPRAPYWTSIPWPTYTPKSSHCTPKLLSMACVYHSIFIPSPFVVIVLLHLVLMFCFTPHDHIVQYSCPLLPFSQPWQLMVSSWKLFCSNFSYSRILH